MKERPIILSGESIRAIQAGCKSHTRRVMKEPWKIYLPLTVRGDWPFQGTWARPGVYEAHHNQYGAVSVKATSNGKMLGIKPAEFQWVTPHGMVGDRLWVREKLHEDAEGVWCYSADGEWVGCDRENESRMMSWVLHKDTRYCSPLFMPRWASRLILEITSITVSRLHSITDEEALLEGVWRPGDVVRADMKGLYSTTDYTPRNQYMHTWEALNFERGYGWNSNPWVWNIGFKAVEA